MCKQSYPEILSISISYHQEWWLNYLRLHQQIVYLMICYLYRLFRLEWWSKGNWEKNSLIWATELFHQHNFDTLLYRWIFRNKESESEKIIRCKGGVWLNIYFIHHILFQKMFLIEDKINLNYTLNIITYLFVIVRHLI